MIDEKIIKEMAFWVRMKVTDEEAEWMAKHLQEQLDWIKHDLICDEMDGLKPMVCPAEEPLVMRSDVVFDGNQRQAVLANAPAKTEKFFSAPKMVE